MGLDRQAAYEVFNREVGLRQTSLQNRLEAFSGGLDITLHTPRKCVGFGEQHDLLLCSGKLLEASPLFPSPLTSRMGIYFPISPIGHSSPPWLTWRALEKYGFWSGDEAHLAVCLSSMYEAQEV